MQTSTNPVTRLAPAQAKAALVLATGASISATARSLGVHRTTIHQWMTDAGFSTALVQARLDHLDLYQRHINRLQTKALTRIEELLDNKSTPPWVALQAAIAILNRPMPIEPNEPENVENATEPYIILQVSAPPTPSNANVQNKPEPPPRSLHKVGLNESSQGLPLEPNDPNELENATQRNTNLQVLAPLTPSNANVQNKPETPPRALGKIGRNESCPCGSGKKYKRCCLK